MTSAGDFAAIAAIERVKNPVAVARNLLYTPHIMLVADGATSLAEVADILRLHPRTLQRRLRSNGTTYQEVLEEARFRLKFRSATEAIDNPLQFRMVRRNIARLNTVLREREEA